MAPLPPESAATISSRQLVDSGRRAPPAEARRQDALIHRLRGEVSTYGKSDIGLHRTNNEDGFVIRDLMRKTGYEPAVVVGQPIGARGVLFAVCGGIGGHHAGEIASSLALETLETEMQRGSGM